MFFCNFNDKSSLTALLSRYQLKINWVEDDSPIPGSWFGDPEAGIIKNQLFVRSDTPIHSALHESCHYICMDAKRRQSLDTDAAGDYDEENGVCYLQILLADYLPEMSQELMMKDMDDWGYTFRLGSAKRWFNEDAEDTYEWLLKYKLISHDNKPTFQLRQ
ncbi:MAG: hypothetical protein OQL19_16765 [Gammaproteobacteria bacterium]|nr:hypothetical protein [Gammaproteobacteria bacterium]